MNRRHTGPVVALVSLVACAATAAAAPPAVKVARVPDGGVQPQVAANPATRVVHLVYLKGDPAASDVFYARSADGGDTWAPPVRVNSQPGSAIAMGTVRGAQLALGRGGRVHVAWNGSRNAAPKAPGNATPLLYARLADDGKTFEPQRNLVTERVGLDGGCSVAADDAGGVFVAWHAPPAPGAGEEARALWLAESRDDGRTFAPERKFSTADQGACGCCGTKLLAAGGRVSAIYRSARGGRAWRDVRLVSQAGQAPADDKPLAEQQAAMCPMSTFALTAGPAGPVAAWERGQQIFWAALDPKTGAAGEPHAVQGAGRKHPAIAVGSDGVTLVAWAEGTGWNKGGSAGWQAFDRAGNPIAGATGRGEGLPAWDLPAVVARADGSFLVLY